ncbi:MAG: hypothetical protein ACK417_06670 [Bacteroidia bacterium]
MNTLTRPMDNQQFMLIDKSDIRNLQFDPPTPSYDTNLMQRLEYAMRLGNTHHVKVRVYFRSLTGEHLVETTIWACDNHSVCLKGGVWIPLHSIVSVDFY